jgi:hypothetical protein
LILCRLQSGMILRAALKRGSDGQVLQMGPFLWYRSDGYGLGLKAVSMDTMQSMRGAGLLHLSDGVEWTHALLND